MLFDFRRKFEPKNELLFSFVYFSFLLHNTFLTINCFHIVVFLSCRINKRGSQKDAEQKANGNYFFYDDDNDDDDDDFDDL